MAVNQGTLLTDFTRHVFAVFLLFNPALHSQAAEPIHWASLDFPPFEIHQAPLKHQGIVDLVKMELQLALPQYQHKDAGMMNQARLAHDFKHHNICHAGLIRTAEIETQAYLSVGIGLMPSHVIITTPENKQLKFRNQPQLTLQRLLKDNTLILGIPSRTMGPQIDPLITLYKGQPHILLRQVTEINGLFDMLLKQRIDYTIGYPAEAIFWNKLHPKQPVITIPLTETNEQQVIGRVACSKNAWGLAVIQQINTALYARRMQDSYIQQIFMPWIQSDAQPAYLRDYRQVLAQDQWTNAQ